MPDYDFSTLSPHDFEQLSRDLLQEELNIRLESFKTGRDKGIDFRYASPGPRFTLARGAPHAKLIVQAKHYFASGYSKLKSVIKSDELPKIQQLSPTRYILSTSVTLTPPQKDELCGILSPFCRGTGDIIAGDDLNNLLGKFPQIEKAHFKLWLPSTAVLTRLLHNGVFTRTAIDIGEIKTQLSLFVPTEAVERSLNMLEDIGFCMLTGIPGIGKTTTARILIAYHENSGWEGYCVSGNAREALDVFDPMARQIFYYDDFLGQTSLEEKLGKNEDKDLNRLIAACRKTPNTKRLVLTTREYLFEQAKHQHEILSRSKVEKAACTVRLEDYTSKIRAQILVNHLFFYGVAPDVCAAFVKSGDARKTIDHKNYNPRIVQSMCEIQTNEPQGREEFGAYFIQLLDSPDQIWRHAYHNQLSSAARQLLLVFAIMGDGVILEFLRAEFEVYSRIVGIDPIGLRSKFDAALEELEGNFLTIHLHRTTPSISYHNPSIKDFTDRELQNEAHLISIVLEHFRYDGVLRSAAQYLLKGAPDMVSAATILRAISRADFETPYTAVRVGEQASLRHPENRVRSLHHWLRITQISSNVEITASILDLVEEFLGGIDPSRFPVSSIVDFYSQYCCVASTLDRAPILAPSALFDRIHEYAVDPDAFMSLYELIEPCQQFDDMVSVLRNSFTDQHWQWLGSEIDHANSSTQVNEAIAAVEGAAEKLGAKSLYLDIAQQKAAELEAHEEAQAEMYEDDFRIERLEERRESEEIDDILRSLEN